MARCFRLREAKTMRETEVGTMGVPTTPFIGPGVVRRGGGEENIMVASGGSSSHPSVSVTEVGEHERGTRGAALVRLSGGGSGMQGE
jgi:hypothetical protein